jgi:hypothetical protein
MNPILSEQGLQMMGGGGASAKGVPTVLNVRDTPYRAKGDGRSFQAAITTATNVLTAGTAAFTASDIGKLVNIVGAGAAGGLLSTTLSGVTNSTTATTTVNASTTVSNQVCTLSSDDGPAFASALSDAHANGGGAVYVPQVAGFYGINQLLDVPDDVWLKGGGRTGTRMCWMSDLGAASGGVRTGPNTTQPSNTPAGANYTLVTDLELVGPGDQNSALNTAPCQMPAVILRDNARLIACNAYGWFAGVSMLGNHQKIEDCRLSQNMHGVMWPIGASTFSNQYIEDSEIVGNKFASLYVHGENMIDGCGFINTHLGFGPYCIYKDNNGTLQQGASSAAPPSSTSASSRSATASSTTPARRRGSPRAISSFPAVRRGRTPRTRSLRTRPTTRSCATTCSTATGGGTGSSTRARSGSSISTHRET